MKLSHALAVLSHAKTLEPVGTLSDAMAKQVKVYETNLAALKTARKAVTLSARRVRELARIAEAVHAPGAFKDVDVKPTKKVPAQRKTMADRAAAQPQANG